MAPACRPRRSERIAVNDGPTEAVSHRGTAAQRKPLAHSLLCASVPLCDFFYEYFAICTDLLLSMHSTCHIAHFVLRVAVAPWMLLVAWQVSAAHDAFEVVIRGGRIV